MNYRQKLTHGKRRRASRRGRARARYVAPERPSVARELPSFAVRAELLRRDESLDFGAVMRRTREAHSRQVLRNLGW